jgi:hypothetical protein
MRQSIYIAACFAALIFAGCSKQESFDARPIKKGDCRINEVLNPDSSVQATFYYTEWGAPSHIERPDAGTGIWEYYFYYDSEKRLIAMNEGINREQEILTSTLSKYYYDRGLIRYDTLLNGTNIDEGTGYYASGEYTYDSRNRIVMYVKKQFIGGRLDTTYFNYPRNENPFRNNTSFLGGNKELMFVNRDYSKTNEGVIESNSQGYPTKVSSLNAYSFLSFGIEWANYSCAPKKSSNFIAEMN